MVDTTYVLPRLKTTSRWAVVIDAEIAVAAALLAIALAIGLATARHYGLSVDEFNTDDYGPKALAWYTSSFTDRAHFETVETYLWMYGPWFQMLVAAAQKLAQSLGVGDPITIRHMLTFAVGLAGTAAVVPIARLAIGRWAGVVALTLCLLTGYFYGNLFFATIDVPFLFAMGWATFAIVLMARDPVPSWRATALAGVFTGLAIATRTGGVILHAYLAGAMMLSALAAVLGQGSAAKPLLLRIAIRSLATVAIAWALAIALWPWLQIGNPLTQFADAYGHFAKIDTTFDFRNWGEATITSVLPWWYIPGQLAVRLPEGFLLLLGAGLVSGIATAGTWTATAMTSLRRAGPNGLIVPLAVLAGARAQLVVAVAAVFPIFFLIVQSSTLYDGIRHILFTFPMLALVAAAGFVRLMPLWRRAPVIAGIGGFVHAGILVATLVILHPLEYVAMNAVAGGVPGAYGRFELDYWSISVPEALRRLERRLDGDPRFATTPPRVIACIGWREHVAGALFHRPWVVELDPAQADFLIATERYPCAAKVDAVLVDEVQRFGKTFAWIYAANRGKSDPGRGN